MQVHCSLGDFQCRKILNVAGFLGQSVAVNPVKANTMMTKEFKENMSIRRLPALQIPG